MPQAYAIGANVDLSDVAQDVVHIFKMDNQLRKELFSVALVEREIAYNGQ